MAAPYQKVPPLDWRTPIVDPSTGNPSDQFVRLWQQTFQNSDANKDGLAGKADKTTKIIAGAGLSGGGDLSADRTLDLDASLGQLNDVDFSTPPTDGQVIVYDAADSKWKPADQSGGGGGGAPTMVQNASIRNDGTVALATAPTVGNTMIWVAGGFGGSIGGYIPTGFTLFSIVFSNGNNAVLLAFRTVQTGDTGSYSVSASDNQYGVLYEFSGFKGIAYINGGNFDYFNSGGNFVLGMFPAAGYKAILLGSAETDTTGKWTLNSATGLSLDMNANPAKGNHTGIIWRADTTYTGPSISGTLNSVSSTVFGLWAIY